MAANYIIHCVDCGAPRHTNMRNTLRCRTCALLKQAAYWHRKQGMRDCLVCESAYHPFDSNHKLCAKCSYTLPEDRGTCAGCSVVDAHLINAEIKLCFACAQDPKKRASLLQRLEERQARQRAEHGDKIGTPIARVGVGPNGVGEAIYAL